MPKNLSLSTHFEEISDDNRELYDAWLSSLEINNYSPATIQQYRSILKIFFSWNYAFNEDKYFLDFLNKDFTKFSVYIRKALDDGASRLNSFRSVLNTMSKFIEKDYEEEYPTFKNKAQNMERMIKTPKRKKVIINPEELQHMLDTLVEEEKYQLACWLAILAYSGCRRSEAIQMKVEWFTEAYEDFPEPYTMWKTPPMRTKGRGEQGKVIPKYIFKSAVKPYLDLWLAEREKLGITLPELFVGKNDEGKYFPADYKVANNFAHAIKTKFKNGFHNHCMRHYFTTDMRSHHFPNDIILRIVKWESPDMIDNYDDTSDDKVLREYFSSLVIADNKPNKEELLAQFEQMSVDELLILLKK